MADSRLPMSGMAAFTLGMEITDGSLGQGLGIAVGACQGLKRRLSGITATTGTRCSRATLLSMRFLAYAPLDWPQFTGFFDQ